MGLKVQIAILKKSGYYCPLLVISQLLKRQIILVIIIRGIIELDKL